MSREGRETNKNHRPPNRQNNFRQPANRLEQKWKDTHSFFNVIIKVIYNFIFNTNFIFYIEKWIYL